jgi:hypothetical protein
MVRSLIGTVAIVWSGFVAADDLDLPDLADKFSFMQWLSNSGLHDMNDERWNAYGQATYISSWKPAFPAAYTNLNGSPNSLSSSAERSFTGTVTAYFGAKAWQGGEVYLAPEMISELPLSDLKGLGGSIQNFELQKTGSVSATWYKSRFYLKQTFNLGGESQKVASGPMQLAGSVDSHRLVFTGGNLSILDIFDKNSYAGDLRQQFLNMAFMTHAAYDFAADARGYTWDWRRNIIWMIGRCVWGALPRRKIPMIYRWISESLNTMAISLRLNIVIVLIIKLVPCVCWAIAITSLWRDLAMQLLLIRITQLKMLPPVTAIAMTRIMPMHRIYVGRGKAIPSWG